MDEISELKNTVEGLQRSLDELVRFIQSHYHTIDVPTIYPDVHGEKKTSCAQFSRSRLFDA